MESFVDPFADGGPDSPPSEDFDPDALLADNRDAKLARAIWEVGAGGHGNEEMGEAKVVGYAVVAEFVDHNGDRWLRKIAGDGFSMTGLPPYQIKGYLHQWLDELSVESGGFLIVDDGSDG